MKRATWKVSRLGSSNRAVVLPKALCELYGIEIGDMLPVELSNDRLVIELADVRKPTATKEV